MDDPWQFARSEQRNKPPTTKNEFGAMKHFSPMYKYVWQWIISVALFNTGSGNPFVKGQLISEWNLVDFLGDLKTTKFHSEINWPLDYLSEICAIKFSKKKLSWCPVIQANAWGNWILMILLQTFVQIWACIKISNPNQKV